MCSNRTRSRRHWSLPPTFMFRRCLCTKYYGLLEGVTTCWENKLYLEEKHDIFDVWIKFANKKSIISRIFLNKIVFLARRGLSQTEINEERNPCLSPRSSFNAAADHIRVGNQPVSVTQGYACSVCILCWKRLRLLCRNSVCDGEHITLQSSYKIGYFVP